MTTTHFINRFQSSDSFAIWNTSLISDIPENMNQLDRNQYFQDHYEEGFPRQIRKQWQQFSDEQWQQKMHAVHFVLVGLNSGDAGIKVPLFENFHGRKADKNSNIAALVYDTPLEGAFMTELAMNIESNSNKVNPRRVEVESLYTHLTELEIPKSAIIIAMHAKVRDALGRTYSQKIRPFDTQTQYIAHYSYNQHLPQEVLNGKTVRDLESPISRATIEALYQK